jgi:KUP system potassium uptake protein
MIRTSSIQRVNGTSVFMTGNLHIIPSALLHNLKHNQVLHRRVVILSVIIRDVPHVPKAKRCETEDVGEGLHLLVVHYGFMDEPNLPEVLAEVEVGGEPFVMMETTFFLGRETLIPSEKPSMAAWRKHLFKLMSRNARSATSYFDLPPNRVVELGMQVEL